MRALRGDYADPFLADDQVGPPCPWWVRVTAVVGAVACLERFELMRARVVELQSDRVHGCGADLTLWWLDVEVQRFLAWVAGVRS